jgi:SprT protein
MSQITKSRIIKSIQTRVEECIVQAEKYYNKSFERPRAIIYKENGTCGGWSNYSTRELMFQIDLMRLNFDEYMNVIIPHEVAHWVQGSLYPYSTSHGREWKSIMVKCFNLPPERCHFMDTTQIKCKQYTRFELDCSCGHVHNLTKRISKVVLTSSTRYRICSLCKTRITKHMFRMSDEFITFAATL